MKNNPNIQREIAMPEVYPKNADMEIAQPAELLQELNVLQNAIDHDEPVTADHVEHLRRSLYEITMHIDGKEMTIDQWRNHPDLHANRKIWQEILSGDCSNIGHMTMMTDSVAGALGASGLDALDLTSINQLSIKQARLLMRYDGSEIWLSKLSQIPHAQLQELMEFKGEWLSLGLTNMTDDQAWELRKFRGSSLRLFQLTDMTDNGAEILAHIQTKIAGKEDLQKRIKDAASRLRSK